MYTKRTQWEGNIRAAPVRRPSAKMLISYREPLKKATPINNYDRYIYILCWRTTSGGCAHRCFKDGPNPFEKFRYEAVRGVLAGSAWAHTEAYFGSHF